LILFEDASYFSNPDDTLPTLSIWEVMSIELEKISESVGGVRNRSFVSFLFDTLSLVSVCVQYLSRPWSSMSTESNGKLPFG
jgi:hypothetical protein